MFGAVAKADTDITTLIRQSLRSVGRTDDTEVTAFTDGCPGLRSILVDAGITRPPLLNWFHVAMRIQHAATGRTWRITKRRVPQTEGGAAELLVDRSIDINGPCRLLFRFKDGDAFRLPPAIRIVPLVTFCVTPMDNEPEEVRSRASD